MKKNLLLFLLLFVSVLAWSQYQLPNSSFETYESDAAHSGAGIRPTSWNASNVSQFGLEMTVLTQDNNGHTGKCAHLKNVTVIGQTSPAWISLGTPWAYLESIAKVNEATAGTDGGTAWTHRPDSVEVWIKRTNNGSEEAFIVYYAWTGTFRGDRYKGKNGQCASTTHYDEESDIRQAFNGNACGTSVMGTQVAEGHWRNATQYPNWTKITVPITYLSNDVPEKMNLILSGGNYPNARSADIHEGSELWVDDVRLIYSSKAHELLLNNRTMTGFNQDTHTYTYTLGATSTTVPTIVPKRSGRRLDASEYTINYGAIGDTTTITINAEDGSSSTTYKILFTTQLSQNSRLADIMVDGTSVTGFNPLIFNYNIALPFGTTTYPTITYTLGEDGQTATVNTPSSFPGTATVTCTAADPAFSTVYSLNFSVAPLNDNTLTDIKVNGKTINGFRPTRNSYVVELPTGTTADPVVTYTTAYPNDQIIVVTNNGLAGGVTITVTPQGTTNTRTYRLNFVITASTYSYLNDLRLDGQTIDGFDPEVFVYYDTLPIGTTQIPNVAWTAGDEYQTITYQPSGIDGTAKVTVTAQAGNSSIYRINFTTLKSTNTALNAIMLDGELIGGFDPDVTNYTVALPLGVTTPPTITWLAGDEYQSITFQDGGLTMASRIVVRASGGATRTYSITFTTTQSSNSRLASLMLGGVQIDGWDPDVTEYAIVLPHGTTSLPNITWTPGDNYQTIRKVEGGVNGDTRITVKAQDGSSTIYIIHFSVLTNTCNYLTSIMIDGTVLPDFNRDTLNYAYQLAGGTTVLPSISYTKGDESQTVAVNRGGVNGVSTITVRAEDGSSRTYSIAFSVAKSANAFLRGISVDNVALAGFDPEVLNYDYEIPATATACPQITVEKNEGQNVTITVPNVIGMVRITVTPETGTQNVYTINIHYPQSSNKLLAGINIDGAPLAGFVATVRNYTYNLTSTALPTVEGVAGDPLQTVHTNTDPARLESRIYVRAESGDTANYTVTFIRRVSSVCQLNDLKVAGTTIASFAPTTFNYSYTLAQGTTVAPAITYTLADPQASVVMTTPALDGTATVTVTAADGMTSSTYTVEFAFLKSSDAALNAVTRNGVNIPAEQFVNDTATITLNYGDALPTIGYVRGNDRQTVMLANAGLQGTDIVVYAEDSTVRHYSVRFHTIPSNNSKLQGLNIDGFNPNVTTYNITLPWRTRTQPQLEPRPAEESQSVAVAYGGINGATTITVTAADGVSRTVYTINYNIKKSSVNYLENLYYDGASIPAFDRDRLSYSIAIPAETTTTPKLTWDLALAPDGTDVIEQTVRYVERPLNDTSFVIVTAEDGSQRTYSVTFRIQESTLDNLLTMIALNGEPLAGFDPNRFNYDVSLPIGTTVFPLVSYVKMFDSQSVEITSDGTDGLTIIKVRSNRRDNDSTIYTIHSEVSTVSSARLTSVTVDGTIFSSFKPTQTSYILSVNEKPEIEVVAATGCSTNILVDNDKKMAIEVTDGVNTEQYVFHYFYQTDVIPNQNFVEWEAASHKGSKPVGWTTPGDVVGCYTWTFLSTCTGSEVASLGGNGGVVLQTTREGDANAIYGSIPGMITTGTMTMNLASAGGSTSSVSGSIPFRNTPQQLYVEYMPIESKSMDNWRMWVNMFDGNTSKQSLFSGSFNNPNEWNDAYLNIDYAGINNVSAMNICLNSGHSENASSYGGITKRTSTVHFRNLHFIYNSALSSISVDGMPLEGFSESTYDYNFVLDAEYSGRPQITMTGQVDDQEHRVAWSEWVNGVLTATIRSIGEDGDQYTEYRIHFTRGNSSNNTLQSITVGGNPLQGFNPSVTSYTVPVTAGLVTLPDLCVVKGSSHSVVTITRGNFSYNIHVVAEDGSARNYSITFASAGHSDSRLADLIIDNHQEVVFDPDTYIYTYNLGAYEAYPRLDFLRMNGEQSVDATDSLITVTAGDGSVSRYVINAVRSVVAPTSRLTDLTIDGEDIHGFSPDTYEYTIDMTGRPSYSYAFSGYSENDRLSVNATRDSLAITVTNATYVVRFARTLGSDDRLSYIRQDGSSIANFDDAIYNYVVTIPYQTNPEFTTRTAASDASLNLLPVANGYDIVATAADGVTTHTTNLRFTPELDTANTLSAIYINGAMLARVGDGYIANTVFRPTTTEYDITLLGDEPKLVQPTMPSISAVATSRDAKVTIMRGTTSTPTIITVLSANGYERDYTLNMEVERSSNTYLSDLAVNYTTVAGFNPTVAAYTYTLAVGETQPVITYSPGDAFQSVEVNTYPSHAEVVVTAESGAVRTYSITFNSSHSSDARINNLLIDGSPIPGFNPNVNDYVVTLPIGTVNAPTVTVVAGDDSQSITVNEGGIDAPTSIVVTAGDGSTTRFYTVTFDVTRSAVDTLSMIYVDGTPLGGFAGKQQNYSMVLPIGVSSMPLVTFDLGDEYQSATLSADTENLIASIQVEAQNGSSRNYLVTFYTQDSHNAQLQQIFMDGDSLDGFAPDTYSYEIYLPVGTTRIPELSWIEGDNYQTINYTAATSVDGIATISVLAGDGYGSRNYTVQFHRTRSSNALLNSISINGTPIYDFDPHTFVYHDTMAVMPLIEFVPGDEYQTFDTIQGSLGSAHVIAVHAEDMTTELYTINVMPVRSSNANLSDISVNGNTIANFDPEQFNYVVEVPYGQTTLPYISFAAAEPGVQNVFPIFANTLSDTTYIYVTAEDGVTRNTYSISYRTGLSDNANLSDIRIFGETLSRRSPYYECDNDFSSDEFIYNIVLPNGMDSIPLIEFTTEVPDVHSATLTVNDSLFAATIEVISQDMLVINEYELRFSVKPSSNAILADLSQADGLLTGFDPNVFDYEVTYPQGTDTASLPKISDITYVKGNPGQSVLVSQNVPTEMVVSVIAEDGVTSNAYFITYLIDRSDNSLLKDIIIKGRSIKNFVPERKSYEYIIEAGDTVPSITAIPSDSLTQVVDITMGFAEDTSYIYVTAEDGSYSTYTIFFANSKTDLTQTPWEDEVSFLPLGDGYYRISCVRKGVIFSIYDLNGRIIRSFDVGLVDPNDDIHDPHHSGGTVFHLDKTNQLYIFTFWYNTKRLKSGKFIR
ncbi:MAG: hypothetical protein MJ002_00175 [Paludibacteraceae bacterium]|nr:hypothetical protein [Paludibacteraceae bacterium]